MTIVEQIHNEIDTAQDRLYNEAVSYINETDSFKEMVAKTERLKKLGFTSTETVVQTEKEQTKSNEAKKKADLIVHYKTRYPFLKFLTKDELDRICEKYELTYAPVQNYKKDVPEKNLRDIENVQMLDSSDKQPHLYRYHIQKYFSYVPQEVKDYIENTIFESKNLEESQLRDLCPIKFNERYLWEAYGGPTVTEIDFDGLFIAAPKSHFDLSNLTEQKKGFFRTTVVKKPEPEDPIVFRHVIGGVQVLTKWGAEANDPMLTNPIDN